MDIHNQNFTTNIRVARLATRCRITAAGEDLVKEMESQPHGLPRHKNQDVVIKNNYRFYLRDINENRIIANTLL